MLILFHSNYVRFCQATPLLMNLYLEALISIIVAGYPILVELIDLVNTVIISKQLLQIDNFSLITSTVICKILFFWISLYLLRLVFVLQWLSFHWEILIRLLSQFTFTFLEAYWRLLHFIAQFFCLFLC